MIGCYHLVHFIILYIYDLKLETKLEIPRNWYHGYLIGKQIRNPWLKVQCEIYVLVISWVVGDKLNFTRIA
jgi:hypothetical protein